MEIQERFRLNEVIRYNHNVGPSELVLTRPHYGRVTKGSGLPGCKEHLAYRRNIIHACKTDKAVRQEAMRMCRDDMLYWFNVFCWLYEPRDTTSTTFRPFNTWPHQDELIASIEHYMGRRMIGVEKSRGEGASWIVLMCFLHQWLFFPMRSFGLVSKEERSVNDIRNPGSLAYKLLWQIRKLEKLTPWMLPRGWDEDKHFMTSKGGTFYNPENESTINGYSATGSVASGDRKTAFLMDELSKFPRPNDREAMASTEPVTDMRIVVGTPYGDSGAYYDCMHEPDTPMLKVVMHWPMNPTRNRGLYRFTETSNKPDIIDTDYEFPSDYGFVKDGKIRSPWYDYKCSLPDMKSNPRKMAQEYDLDYGGSTAKFYDAEMRDKIHDHLRDPIRVGDIDYDTLGSKGVWVDTQNGNASCWMQLKESEPPPGQYVVGVDIAAGLKGPSSSNSAIIVLDASTGVQVFEWKDNGTRPSECAHLAVAICMWLTKGGLHPLLVWENNGPTGQEFTEVVVNELRYPHLYYRWTLTKLRKKHIKQPGYRSVDPAAMHEKVRFYLLTGRATILSGDLFEELSQFEYVGDKVEHNSTRSKEDGATGKAHGDIVTAFGMAVIGLDDIGGGAKPDAAKKKTGMIIPSDAPPGSLGSRLGLILKKDREEALDLVGW